MPTDNNRYSMPFELGDGPWDERMNNNLDDLAVDVPKSGPLADRKNASQQFAPRFYFATDENVWYYNTGAAWTQVGNIITPSGTSGAAIQAAIDEAKNQGWNSRVVLNPAKTYVTSSEIHLRAGITLECNNARIEVASNVNGIFCDHHTKLKNVNIRPTAEPYSSDLVNLDTGRAGGGYGAGGLNTSTHVDGLIHGNGTQATGLHCFVDDSTGIGLGNHFRLIFDRCGQAIHMDAPNGWINTSPIYCDIVHCERGILENGGGGYVEYYGSLQPQSGYSKNAIVNNSDGNPVFHGIIWDGHRFDGSEPILQGSDITIYSPFCNILAQQSFNSDGSPRQIIIDQNASSAEFMTIQDIANDEWFGLEFRDGSFIFREVNGEDLVALGSGGDVRFPDANLFPPTRNIQTETPSSAGEICIATQSSSPNNESSLCFSADGSTWTVLDGTEVNPS